MTLFLLVLQFQVLLPLESKDYFYIFYEKHYICWRKESYAYIICLLRQSMPFLSPVLILHNDYDYPVVHQMS